MYLIATGEISRVVSRYYQRSSTLSENWVFVGVLLAIVIFWVGLVYWDRLRRRVFPFSREPNSLFLELCYAHRLNRGQRMLLMKAANTGRVEHAAVVFVDPGILERLAASESDEARDYREMLVRLFGERESSGK